MVIWETATSILLIWETSIRFIIRSYECKEFVCIMHIIQALQTTFSDHALKNFCFKANQPLGSLLPIKWISRHSKIQLHTENEKRNIILKAYYKNFMQLVRWVIAKWMHKWNTYKMIIIISLWQYVRNRFSWQNLEASIFNIH